MHLDTAFAIDGSHRIADAYRALRLAPGSRVDYHGSVASIHGVCTVQPCACSACFAKVLLGLPASRYQLRTLDGGHVIARHVRHTSVTPLPSPTELNEAVIGVPTKAVAVYLRAQLRRAFPGVTFSVRTGRGKNHRRITVSWTAGPRRTAVSTVTAPLLASFDTPQRFRAQRISVRVGGRTLHGTPMVADIQFNRA